MRLLPSLAVDRSDQLSRHFTLGQFLVDETFPELAAALSPSDEVLESLTRLARVLDAVEDEQPGGWRVRSGYRDKALNTACRDMGMPASIESLHLLGCAADVEPMGDQDLERLFDWISVHVHQDLDLQEAVYYPRKGFIHIAVPHPEFKRPRRFIMRV